MGTINTTMSIVRSDNCASYTDTISLLVTGEAAIRAGGRVPRAVARDLSCQTSAFEAPDPVTRSGMEAAGMDALELRG